MVPMEEVNALSLRCFKPPGYNYKAGLLSNPPNLLFFQPREYTLFSVPVFLDRWNIKFSWKMTFSAFCLIFHSLFWNTKH